MPAIGETCGAAQWGLMRAQANDPHRAPRALLWLRLELGRRHVEPCPMILYRSAAPAGEHDLDRLVGDRTALREQMPAAQCPELAFEPADADAQVDPSAREMVQTGDRARGENGIAIRGDEHARHDPDSAGP